MKVSRYPQRSEEWHQARLGLPTASNASKLITPAGKRSTTAKTYLRQLAWERVTGETGSSDYVSAAMRDGIEREDDAADACAKALGLTLETVGLCTTDDGRFGASFDRLVKGTSEAVEIKCPTGPTHVGYLLDGCDDYRAQIAAQFMVSKFDRIHFWSYHPQCPSYHTVFTYLEFRPFIALLDEIVREFCDALDNAEKKLRAMDWTWDRGLTNWTGDEPW